MTTERTPAWFANPKDGKSAAAFVCKDLNGIGEVAAAINAEMDMSVTHKDSTVLVKARSNSYGPYWIAEVGAKRYFVSRRTSKKDGSFYLLFKEAIDRPLDASGRPQRPATYGK
jgi:hypothetical protein